MKARQKTRTPRTRAAAAAVGFAAMATATAGLVVVPASAAKAGIDWHRCDDAELRKAGARCGTLTVPLDRDHPNGKKVRLAVSRIKATAPAAERQGVLLNPYLQFPIGLDDVPERVRATYDLVGFDLRGTGESRPRLNCGPNPWGLPQPAYRPTTGPDEEPGDNERAWLARYERFTRACDRRYGDDLEHFTTTDSAADMEALRVALGADRLNLLTGGYLGAVAQTYATLHPRRIGRMVLDGSFDPAKRGFAGVFEDTPGTEDGIHRFFAWVARHDDVYFLGATADAVADRYYRGERALTAHRLKKFGPAEWSDTFRNVAFDEPSWPELASAWAKWERGRTKPMLEFAADPSTATEQAAFTASYLAQGCSEGDWPRDYAPWREAAFAEHETSPFLAWSSMLNAVGCRTWPAKHEAPPVGSDDAGGMLLVAAGDDGAYYGGSLGVRRLFPDAVLASVPGSVTAPLFTGNDCIDRLVVRYLRDGTLPDRRAGDRADATCEAAAKPKPLPADVKAAKKLRAAGYARGGDGGAGGPGADGGDGGDARVGGRG